MWGRKDDTPAAAPVASPRSEPTPQPAAQTAPAPVPAPRPAERKGGQSLIGKSIRVKGAVSGAEDLYVDGEVEGTIELEQNVLTIGPNGRVNADVKAREITVLGHVTGSVVAGERIEIRKTGSVEGDIKTNRIVIEDGAVFRGSIDIVKGESARSKTPSTPEKKAAAPAAKSADGSQEAPAKAEASGSAQ